jgi:hypothetical protein
LKSTENEKKNVRKMPTFLTLKRTTPTKFQGKIHPTTSHEGPEGE